MEQTPISENFLTTRELAEKLRVAQGTIRRSLCVYGHYCGLKPLKLSGHHLLWRGTELRKLLTEGNR